MERRTLASSRGLASLVAGDHICHLYRDRDEQVAAMQDFFQDGLQKGEKCLFMADREHRLLRNPEAMADGSMSYHERGVLEEVEFLAFPEDRASGESWAALLEAAAARARQEGFAGLRVVRDLGVGLSPSGQLSPSGSVEAGLCVCSRQVPVVLLCQYDRPRLMPGLLKDLILTHPLILMDGTLVSNGFYAPPEEYLSVENPDVEAQRYLNALARQPEIHRLKKEWMAGVAHKLRTPLTSILGYAELLMQEDELGGLDPDQRKEFLAEICDKVEALSGIIRDLLYADPENPLSFQDTQG